MNGLKGIRRRQKLQLITAVPNLRLFLCSLIFAVVSFAVLAVDASAQNDDQNELAPPPLKLVSKDEKVKLDSDHDPKSRTKLAIELMNARILTAEKLVAATDFDGVFRELGCFEALLDNQLEFLIRNDNDSGRVLDNFKRLEIGLRGYGPRIEAIRRDLPSRYEPFVRSVGKYIRDARTKTLDPLFSDTVVRQPER